MYIFLSFSMILKSFSFILFICFLFTIYGINNLLNIYILLFVFLIIIYPLKVYFQYIVFEKTIYLINLNLGGFYGKSRKI